MTATALSHSPRRLLEPTDSKAPSGFRLWLVELRKLVDTPSGIALLAGSAVFAGVFGGGAALFIDNVTFGDIARLAGIPLLTLMPVFAILLATSGRQHRTVLTTYALVPSRSRVLAAQLLAVIALALLAAVLLLAAAAIITPVGGLVTSKDTVWQIDWFSHLRLTAGIVLAAVSGYAVGLATGLAPVAITIVLAWPVLSLFLSILPRAAEILAWLDINAVAALGDGVTGTALARVATGIAVWIIVPGIIGFARELRAEVR